MEAYLAHMGIWSAAGMTADALAHGTQIGFILAVVIFKICATKLAKGAA